MKYVRKKGRKKVTMRKRENSEEQATERLLAYCEATC